MKIDNLLKEQFDAAVDVSDSETFSELNSFQISCLVRMYKGTLDYDTATPREMDIIDSLRDLGLVNGIYELSPEGVKDAEYAMQYGSVDRKRASYTDAKLNRRGSKRSRYTDFDDGSDIDQPDPDSFKDKWNEVRDYD